MIETSFQHPSTFASQPATGSDKIRSWLAGVDLLSRVLRSSLCLHYLQQVCDCLAALFHVGARRSVRRSEVTGREDLAPTEEVIWRWRAEVSFGQETSYWAI